MEKEILDVVIQDLSMISSGTMDLHVHSILFFYQLINAYKGKIRVVQIYLPSRSFFKKKDLLLEHSRKEVLNSNKSIINHIFTFNINKNSLLLMALQDSCQSNIENSKNRYKALSLLTRCARETQILNTKSDNVK